MGVGYTARSKIHVVSYTKIIPRGFEVFELRDFLVDTFKDYPYLYVQ